jgi:hypothetical protein
MDIIDENQIKNAISRSGYLLEGRIIKKLAENDYYLTPSERYSDPKTGIDREIDIIGLSPIVKNKISSVELRVNHELIIECTNNPQPIVFFTIGGEEKLLSSHSPCTSWCTDGDSQIIKKLRDVPIFELTHSGNYFLNGIPSVQYCSFIQKKGTKEWMALHPDDVHSMMTKFKDYLEQRIASYESFYSTEKDNKFRHILFRMVWVTTSDLYLASEINGEVRLTKRDLAFYLHKFSHKNQTRDIIIDVVTENHFSNYLELNKEVDKRLVDAMVSNAGTMV